MTRTNPTAVLRGPRPVPIDERFWQKVDRCDEDKCWQWLASADTSGYGKIDVSGTTLRAHRVAYELLVGAIPDGMVIDHICRNRLCVNPAHLEPVTAAENVRRGERAQRTHCVHGHEYTPENTLRHRGRRRCRECKRIARSGR